MKNNSGSSGYTGLSSSGVSKGKKTLDVFFYLENIRLYNIIIDSYCLSSDLITSSINLKRQLVEYLQDALMKGNIGVYSKIELKLDREVKEYYLPSIDFREYFNIDSNNVFGDMLKKHGVCKEPDTESCAFYPRFKTREEGEFFINDINNLFTNCFFGKEVITSPRLRGLLKELTVDKKT